MLGNGHFYVGLDETCCLREIFWPVTGLENHAAETKRNRLGVWYDGQLFPVGGNGWQIQGEYGPGMTFRWEARLDHMGLSLWICDALDPYEPVWSRQVRMLLPGTKPAGMYSKQSYNLGENTIGEGAFWDEERKRLYHYKGSVWAGICLVPEISVRAGVAKMRDGGVYVRSDLGQIVGRSVDHGLIESIIGLTWDGASEFSAEYILAMGKSRRQADSFLDMAKTFGTPGVMERSRRYWEVCGFRRRTPAGDSLDPPGQYAQFADLSLRILASHCDAGGGVLASCDTDIMSDFRDHYRYVWPRDAALCTSTLIRAGRPEFARRYLEFCARIVSCEGYMWQRYRPDGSRGSGWYPPGPKEEPPIQEDETALSLVTAGEYLDHQGDLDFLWKVYHEFVAKAARFLVDYTTDGGTLVKPSFDLWEERCGIFTFTQASCVVGLVSSACIDWTLGQGNWRDYLQGGLRLLKGLAEHLSDDHDGLARGVVLPETPQKDIIQDWTPDASLFMVPLLFARAGSLSSRFLREAEPAIQGQFHDLLRLLTARSRRTWDRLAGALLVELPGERQGVARYPGDWYCRVEGTRHPGNPWPVATVWYLLAGYKLGMLDKSFLLAGADQIMRSSVFGGVLAEQYLADSGMPASVAPLAWSHAAYLDLVMCLQEPSSDRF